MGDAEVIAPDRLRQLAQNMLSSVSPELTSAKSSFEAADIGPLKFSKCGIPMGIIYPLGQEWAIKTAEAKDKQVHSIADRLNATADLWSGAETHNIITC